MNWIFYALLSPIVASVTNYIEKFLLENELDNPIVFTIFMGITYTIFAFPIFFIFKIKILPPQQMIFILLGGMLNTLYILPYFKALTLDETSRVVPLFQFVPVFTLVLSSIFLGEHLTAPQFIGFAFILFGGFFISISKFDSSILNPRPALWYMVLSSFFYAVLAICFKFVVIRADFWTTFFYQIVGSGITAFLLLCIPANAKKFIKTAKSVTKIFYAGLFINITFSVLFELLSAFAVSLAPVALVLVLGGIQPFVVLIFGIILSVWFPHIIEENIEKSTIILKTFFLIIIFIGILFIAL